MAMKGASDGVTITPRLAATRGASRRAVARGGGVARREAMAAIERGATVVAHAKGAETGGEVEAARLHQAAPGGASKPGGAVDGLEALAGAVAERGIDGTLAAE